LTSSVLDLRLPQGNGVAMLRDIRKVDQERPSVMVFSGTIKKRR
jgi:DNA-binding response OmpR family regulator